MEDKKEETPECTCHHTANGQYDDNPKCEAHPDESILGKLERENSNFKTVMIAAAEEIKRCWQAHCDEKGYGPQNLLHRLEKGIPAQYGYTAGAFEKLQSQLSSLKEENKRLEKAEVLWFEENVKLREEIENLQPAVLESDAFKFSAEISRLDEENKRLRELLNTVKLKLDPGKSVSK